MGCADLLVVLAGLGQAQRAIRRVADNVGIGVVLPVVVPPADSTEAQAVGSPEGLVSTAHAASRAHKQLHKETE
jgi:hypothetical protein